MASGLVIHIEVGDEKHTEVLMNDRIRIGSCEDCDLRLRLPRKQGDGGEDDAYLFLELARTNGHYRIGDFKRSLDMTHNGVPLVYGTAVEDGDEVRVNDLSLSLQFFPLTEQPAPIATTRRPEMVVAPFIENAAIEAAATARRDDAKVFLREFTRELLKEINLSTKVITLFLVFALVGGLLYLGYAGYTELRRSREQMAQINQQNEVLKEALDRTSDQFKEVGQKNQDIIDSLSLAPRLISEYGNGVCLIVGTYELVESGTGRPLRYAEIQTTEEGEALQSGEDQPMLTPEGNGLPYINDVYGTGFHVGDGFVVTNRHIGKEPWTADPRVESLSASVGGQFRVTRLLAYFPGRKQPFVLRLKQAARSEDIDLAVCAIDSKELPKDLPVLPLDKDSDATGIGKSVVMMGYPRGADRLLTYLPNAQSQNIQQRFGSSAESLVSTLAQLNLIKPQTSQGYILDLTDNRVVYDARTSEGGSGAPLFGQSGRVIAINYGTYTQMQGSNYAVPVNFALTLLQRAGWKPKDAPPTTAEATAGNSNTNQRETRAAP